MYFAHLYLPVASPLTDTADLIVTINQLFEISESSTYSKYIKFPDKHLT